MKNFANEKGITMKPMNYNMKSDAGNEMVERVVQAAVDMRMDMGASLLDLEGFVSNNFQRLEESFPEVLSMPVVKAVLHEIIKRAEIEEYA